ncbi:MAG TPA: HAD-IIIC family phosphatase [Bryobacteraceae bacterium]|nr:HAD-IIIC family phosphatase [Bryobacteraceae bacterium]
MKLAEALSIVQKTSAELPEFGVLLACGITPLHLQNYLAAHLQALRPDRKVRISSGLFGDLVGTLDQASRQDLQAVALVVEWSDLDPRLGYRQLGGWGQIELADTVEAVEAMLNRLENAVASVPKSLILAVSLPTLALPPGFHTSGWHASAMEIALERAVADFAARIGRHSSTRVVNRQKLDLNSIPATRYDFRSDLNTGFPYTTSHADVLGSAMANLIAGPVPKKGLITDLDDTFWAGLVGEVGHENISWDLSSHTQLHGLYQQTLGMLADHGVLVAIASKNSAEVVNRALSRPDLAISKKKIFPVEAHWDAKSGSVSRILKTWNIAADSVVFVDDSPMELEEVRAAHPGMECVLFPKNDYSAGLALLHSLRDLFGKPGLSEEDNLRLESIRAGQELSKANGDPTSVEHFLARLEARVILEYNSSTDDKRVLELVNKTNQFNLNGGRYTAAEWGQISKWPGAFVLAISYADKFGPLGKIGVLAGREEGRALYVRTWVMSCRAFSRRIEHACISALFQRFGSENMFFEFKATSKNGPISDFLAQFSVGSRDGQVAIEKTAFETKCPKLYHQIVERNG